MEKTDPTIDNLIHNDNGRLDDVHVVRVRIPAPLFHQLEDLVREPSFRFRDLEHLVVSGLWSFAAYKNRQLARLRDDAEGVR